MNKGDTVYVVNVDALRIETGTLVYESNGRFCNVDTGNGVPYRTEVWRVFAVAQDARLYLAEKMHDRAAALRREADDLDDRASHLVLTQSVPHTPA